MIRWILKRCCVTIFFNAFRLCLVPSFIDKNNFTSFYVRMRGQIWGLQALRCVRIVPVHKSAYKVSPKLWIVQLPKTGTWRRRSVTKESATRMFQCLIEIKKNPSEIIRCVIICERIIIIERSILRSLDNALVWRHGTPGLTLHCVTLGRVLLPFRCLPTWKVGPWWSGRWGNRLNRWGWSRLSRLRPWQPARVRRFRMVNWDPRFRTWGPVY